MGAVCVALALASAGAWPAAAHLRDPAPATLAVATPKLDAPSAAATLSPEDLAREQNAGTPISTAPNPAARPFRLAARGVVDEARATDCMTAAIYYEAGYESPDGQRAVAQVVLNRLRNPLFPKTVCGVVFQRCQFSFTCDGALRRKPSDEAWDRARKVAVAALHGYVMKKVGNATHYHADYVAPAWSPSLVKVAVVGQHIFYRWTGGLGLPPAFRGRYAGGEMKDLEIAMLDKLSPTPERLATRATQEVTTVSAPPPAAPVIKAAPVPAALAAGDQTVDANAVAPVAGPVLEPDALDRRRQGPPRLARPDDASPAGR